jgi:predicted RNA-binding Zn-ribbon protein involved in translation (DUF1610 family)
MSKIISLNVKCPNCHKSLMDHNYPLKDRPSIKLNIEIGSNRGILRLCSIYGCYDHESDIEIPKDTIARFYCPQCNKEIKGSELCDVCQAPMIPFILEIGGRVNICSRSGCTKHYVAFEDLSDAIRKFYKEYGIY